MSLLYHELSDLNGRNRMVKNNKKVKLGQFFTKKTSWLKKQIVDFILQSNCKVAYDPFVGDGDILAATKTLGNFNVVGLDIDNSLTWSINDSLIHIPSINNAIIVTNPPYLTNYSASRKKIYESVEKYFNKSNYCDLYLIALDKMLEAQNYVVAIIPETFINSNYKQKNKLSSITILEDNPFHDTDTPVCIACFDGKEKKYEEIKVYKNETYVCTLLDIEDNRLLPKNNIEIAFNVLDGWLGLRAVDSISENDMLRFDFKENFNYNWEKGIKISSRLLSVIDINIPLSDRKKYISMCNEILNNQRRLTNDLIFSPFKGNMKNGKRRRRLDFKTARAIMELAYEKLYKGDTKVEKQLRLF